MYYNLTAPKEIQPAPYSRKGNMFTDNPHFFVIGGLGIALFIYEVRKGSSYAVAIAKGFGLFAVLMVAFVFAVFKWFW